MNDPHQLQRFVDAQAPVIETAMREVSSGRKQSHWMWFVFPQIVGLGRSPTARHYAIASLDEARAYLAHRTLGERLRRCTDLVNAVEGRSAFNVFGSPDDMKFHSSMTLFKFASDAAAPFTTALDRYFAGADDPATVAILTAQASSRGDGDEAASATR